MSKIYLGLLQRHGRTMIQVYHDEVPRALREKGSPLRYCARLDILPNGEVLAKLSLNDLLAVYRGWEAKGTLPPDRRD